MADLTDVFNKLVDMSATAVYPNGTSQPSVCGKDVVLYAGWAIASRLDDDLKIQKVHVSVYARPEEHNTTRYLPDWQDLEVYPAAITLTVAGNTVIVGGTVADKHNATLIINSKSYSYSVQANDTLSSIAQALADLVSVDLTATVTGSVIEIPGAYSVVARVGTFGLSMRELRRQERTFQIVVWAATPQLRDTVASAIDVYFAKYLLEHNQQITLADQSKAKVTYKGSPITDDLQKDRLYRRDLLFSVDYATTEIKEDVVITTTQTNGYNTANVKIFEVNL